MGEPASQIMVSDDLWWKKTMEWVTCIGWDGMEEIVVGAVTDLMES